MQILTLNHIISISCTTVKLPTYSGIIIIVIVIYLYYGSRYETYEFY